MNDSVREEIKKIVSEVVEENMILMVKHLTQVIKEHTEVSKQPINEGVERGNKLKSYLDNFSESVVPEHEISNVQQESQNTERLTNLPKSRSDYSPGGIHSKTKGSSTSGVKKSVLGGLLANTRPLEPHEQSKMG
jgi:hypothetical protein